MGTVIPFERRSEKAQDAAAPVRVGLPIANPSARRLCVVSAVYGAALAASIEADAVPLVIVLLLGGYVALRRLP